MVDSDHEFGWAGRRGRGDVSSPSHKKFNDIKKGPCEIALILCLSSFSLIIKEAEGADPPVQRKSVTCYLPPAGKSRRQTTDNGEFCYLLRGREGRKSKGRRSAGAPIRSSRR